MEGGGGSVRAAPRRDCAYHYRCYGGYTTMVVRASAYRIIIRMRDCVYAQAHTV
jgi:hypothetical protein